MRLTHDRTAIRYYIGALAMIEYIELLEIEDHLWAIVEAADGFSVEFIRMHHVDEDGAEG